MELGDRLDHAPKGDGARFTHDGGRLYVVATADYDWKQAQGDSETAAPPDLETCCYTLSHSDAVGACEEYMAAWVSMEEGTKRTPEVLLQEADAADPDEPLPTTVGFCVRHDLDSLCMRLLVYRKRAADGAQAPARLVRAFGVYPCNKWIDDFMEEATPAVRMLQASDRTEELFGSRRAEEAPAGAQETA